MIITRAPYRISFLGGGTDFPEWYEKNGGAVISTTINKYCYITARWLPPFFEHKHRIVWSRTELTNTVDEIFHPVVKNSLKYFDITKGIEIHHAGDLPARSGMGTSSSFAVALLQALTLLVNKDFSKREIGKMAIYVEQKLCGDCVGSQDQTASAHGGLNRIDFSYNGIEVKPLSRGKGLEDRLLLFFTGFQRNASDIEKRKLQNIQSKEKSFRALYQLANEGESLLRNGKLNEFGKLLHTGWQIKRSMADKTSTDYIDFLYQKGLNAGAVGGKLLGAGGGGFLLFYAEPDAHTYIKQAMDGLLYVPFKFERKGVQIVFSNDNAD